ncbi:FkbM family methyltransferase [Salinactinospora qingdaonensis]|uniref:FkbM family methyltransferase n=1 Tax=Salinactinospora qingdaonensis TaxID=702744 RepID=A0ABP7GG89_9ACTN
MRTLGRTTPWLEPELAGLRSVVRSGAVCVDAGAALGLYTAVLADLVGPRGTVHSVEPLLFAHPVWNAVLRPRAGGNVQRHALALGAAPEETVIRVPVRRGSLVTGRSFIDSGAHGVGSNDEFESHIDVRVQVDTLDRLCASAGIDRVDFIKADVEGAELALLTGARVTIERDRPDLLIEIEERHARRYGTGPEAVVDWLTQRGYRMYALHGATWRPIARVVAPVRNYLFRCR